MSKSDRKPARRLAVTLLASTLALVGCGGQQGAGNPTAPAAPTSTVSTPATTGTTAARTATTTGAVGTTVNTTAPKSDNIILGTKDRSTPVDPVVGDGSTSDIAAPIPAKTPAK